MPLSPKRKRMILFWLAFGLAVLVVLLGSIAGIVIHTGHRAAEAFEKSRNKTTAQILLSTRVQPEQGPRDTSVTLSSSKYSLHFAPLVIDTPDLPVNVRAIKDRLNQEYDKLLLRIEDYEKRKNRLTFQESRQIIVQIVEDMYKPWESVRMPNFDDSPRGSSLWKMREAYVQVAFWYEDALIEVYARDKQFDLAGNLSQRFVSYHVHEWMFKNQVHSNDVVRDYMRSKKYYFRERGYEDYYRPIYYYWQSGTLNGYAKIFDVVVPHWWDEVNDDLVRKGILGAKDER